MDFVLTEVEVETDDFKLEFSDDEYMECESSPSSEDEYFIDDSCQDDEEEEEKHDPSFYRSFDNRENYFTFKNQFRNPVEVSKKPDDDFYGEDDLPELFDPDDRERLLFIHLKKIRKRQKNLKRALFVFLMLKIIFYAVIYGIMHEKLKKQTLSPVFLKDAQEVLGKDLFLKLKEIEPDVMLDHTLFGFFYRCHLINEVLGAHGFFKKFYERSNKFRYQLRQRLKSKNEMKRELSVCIIQKFNGYELLRNNLQYFEKKFCSNRYCV